MLHELGAHIGMPKLLGAVNYARLVGHLYDWAAKNDGSLESRLAKKALARIRNAEEATNAPMSESDAHDELLAYFIEEAVENGLDPTAIKKGGPLYQWFRTLWAAAKVALRKIGLNRLDDITAQNIVDLAYGAAKLEITGTWHGTAADFRNFNHDYMGSGEGAQAYGWGTYLAQRPGIAKEYWAQDVRRKSTSSDRVVVALKNDLMGARSDIEYAEQQINLEKEALAAQHKAYASIKNTVKGKDALAYWADLYEKEYFPAAEERLQRAKQKLVRAKEIEARTVKRAEEMGVDLDAKDPVGSLMRADVNVHDDEMLDWDKPLAEQSATVRDLINKHIDPHGLVGKYFAEDVVDFETGDVVFKAGEKITVGSIATLVNDMGHTEIAWADKPGGAAQTFDANMWWTMQHYKAKDNRGGKSVYNGIAFHLFLNSGGKDVHNYTTKDQYGRTNGLTDEGWDKAYKLASTYLDSIGIKGLRFLDAQSRNMKDVAALEKKLAAVKEDLAKLEARGPTNQMRYNDVAKLKLEVKFREGELAAAKKTAKNQTRNIVVFNDKNIHRIYTEVGANPYDIKFSIGATNSAAKTGFENQKAGAIAQLKEGANRALHLVAFTRDLVDIAHKEGLTTARNYYRLSNMRDAEQTRIEAEVDRILTDAYKLSKGDRAAAQKFIKESTIAQKWGFMPDWKKEATVDPDFKKKFSALSKEAQTTVKQLFKHADTMHKQLQEQINAEIDREYDKRVKAALDAGNDGKAREIERDRKRALSVVGRKLPEMQGPYAPLKRFGNHVFVGKSQRYLDAERDNDKKEIARLIKLREGDYEVTFFDNKYQATVYARENQHRFAPNGDVFGRQMGYDKFKEVPWGEILKIKTAIEAEPGDLKGKNAMQRLVTDLYISLLSDASARKTEMRREGVEGASDEMFRAFATKGRADAHFFAAMKHNGDIQRAISDMRMQTRRVTRTGS